MKLQPRLRVTGQDVDFTQDKLDKKLLRNIHVRNRKEESERMQKTLNSFKPAPTTTKLKREDELDILKRLESQTFLAHPLKVLHPNNMLVLDNFRYAHKENTSKNLDSY